jgi:hypothetical protein
MRRSTNPKHEEAPLFRELTSESDISEDIAEIESRGKGRGEKAYIDELDRAPMKSLRMEVSLASERRDNDFFVYEKKVAGGVKIAEHSLVFSRRKLAREEVRVEAVPLKLPNKLIYFEF